MRTDKESIETLEEIREALKELDNKRVEEGLDKEERADLEMSAVALREAERLLISDTQERLVKEMESVSRDLKEFSSMIRSRVTNLNKTAKYLDKAESIIRKVLKITGAVQEWI